MITFIWLFVGYLATLLLCYLSNRESFEYEEGLYVKDFLISLLFCWTGPLMLIVCAIMGIIWNRDLIGFLDIKVFPREKKLPESKEDILVEGIIKDLNNGL